MLGQHCGYNIYNIKKDEWLLDSNNRNIELKDGYFARSVLVTDDILVTSCRNDLRIYSIQVCNSDDDDRNDST